MFAPFNLFLRLTDISLRLTIQKIKFCSTVGALLGRRQLFGVLDGSNGNSLGLFYVLLTVHLSIILVIDQLNDKILVL